MQLVLYQETKEEQMEREIHCLKQDMGNLRRGLFARHSSLEKKYQETYFELELLKSSIAKQDIKIWESRSSLYTPKKKQRSDSPDLFTF